MQENYINDLIEIKDDNSIITKSFTEEGINPTNSQNTGVWDRPPL